MYRTIHLRIATALTAIFCLMFSQLALAAYACPVLSTSSAPATMSAIADVTDNNDGPCVERDTALSGLCAAHCNPTDLSLTSAQVDVPAPVLVALHWRNADIVPETGIAVTLPADLPLRAHPPPLSILHCCFRL